MAAKFDSGFARQFRTSSFRVAILGALIAVCGAVAVFFVIYHATRATVQSALDSTVVNEEQDILSRAILYNMNVHNLQLAMQQSIQVAMQRSKGSFYELRSKDNVAIEGNLDLPPNIATVWHGWKTLKLGDGIPLPPYVTAIRGFGFTLSNGDTVYIAENASSYYALDHLLGRIFLIIFTPALLLGLLGGLLVARNSLNRISLIANVSREIVNGDLSRRLPISENRDEFDELSDVLNTMLNKLEVLVENIRQVTNNISHDLRAPLARLRERLELARQNTSKVSTSSLVDEAIAQVDGALALFAAMLRISEIESGARRKSFRKIALSETLQDLAATYDAVAELDGMAIISSIQPDLEVEGDFELLYQMFVNIIENAIRHCPQGTEIFISGEHGTEGRITVVVADNGYGIPKEERERVFERFVRLTTARQAPGSGLGLALVAAIATMHGYAIRLEDNNPGLKVIIDIH